MPSGLRTRGLTPDEGRHRRLVVIVGILLLNMAYQQHVQNVENQQPNPGPSC
jgi:hypothetical protein